MAELKLRVLAGEFAIHRFDAGRDIPREVFAGECYFIGRTDEELSVVCEAGIDLDSDRCVSNWACLKVEGPLEFGLTGVLSGIARVLAEAEISIFAMSTYDTDYILLQTEKLAEAIEALKPAGYVFPEDRGP